MKKRRQKLKKKFNFGLTFVVSLIFVAVISAMTVGFAAYESILHFNGNVSIAGGARGRMYISNVENIAAKGGSQQRGYPIFTGNSIEYGATFYGSFGGAGGDRYFTYRVTLVNDDSMPHAFNMNNSGLKAVDFRGRPIDPPLQFEFAYSGINEGDIIPARTTIVYELTIRPPKGAPSFFETEGGSKLGVPDGAGYIHIENASSTGGDISSERGFPRFTDDKLMLDARTDTFGRKHTVSYEVTIKNDDSRAYVFVPDYSRLQITDLIGQDISKNVQMQVSYAGINENDLIPAKSSVSFTLTLDFTSNRLSYFNLRGDIVFNFSNSQRQNYAVYADIIGSNFANLVGGGEASVKVHVKSHENINRYFTFRLDAPLDISIASNQELVVPAYGEAEFDLILRNNTLDYAQEFADARLFLVISGVDISVGALNLQINELRNPDKKAPVVSALSFEAVQPAGNGELSWTITDDSPILETKVLIYGQQANNVETLVREELVQGSSHGLHLEGLEPGVYRFVVYASDVYGNVASAKQISAASAKAGVARSLGPIELKWVMNVEYKLKHVDTSVLPQTVNLGGELKIRIIGDDSLNAQGKPFNKPPKQLKVRMGGKVLPAEGYSYDPSTGQLNIPNVQGDLKIEGSATI